MTQAILLSALLVVTGASPRRSPQNRLGAAQSEFNQGDFGAALKSLGAAENETADDPTLAKIYLLEGQCYGAQRDFGSAEQAFARAIEHDPTVQLDPAKVDPDLVRLLEGVRERLHGELRVRSDHPGARVTVDHKFAGTTPLTTTVTVGRHSLEVRSADGRVATYQEAIVSPQKRTDVSVSLPDASSDVPRAGNCDDTGSGPVLFGFGKPVADLSLDVDPFQVGTEGAAIEIGAGLEAQYVRLSLHARVFPIFGVTAKAALVVPVIDRVRAYLALQIPLLVPNPTGVSGQPRIALGLGGLGGAEFLATRWLSPYVEIGARHYFVSPDNYEQNRLTLSAGLRLRLP